MHKKYDYTQALSLAVGLLMLAAVSFAQNKPMDELMPNPQGLPSLCSNNI